MQALIVDDEPLARQRLVQLLGRLEDPVTVLAQFGDAGSAFAWLQAYPGKACICFLDIQMPGPDGLHLAAKILNMPQAPMVVFVTAHAEHACHAFDLQASDYLTKPVRIERLAQTVERCRKMQGMCQRVSSFASGELHIQERQRLVRIPYQDILYLKAELKYVTVQTSEHQYMVDRSLNDLQKEMGETFIRIHRNTLVARTIMRSLKQHDNPDGTQSWAVQVGQTNEWLKVSRRQVALVRKSLSAV